MSNVFSNLKSKDGLYWLLWYIVYNTFLKRFLSDRAYIKLMYRCAFKKDIDLQNPQSFSEKENWMKLYDRNPLYIKFVDKYEVKALIDNVLGGYIIQTIGGPWNSVDEIDWDSLPKQFVLKCTHDSGGLVICKNKDYFDIEAAKKILRKSMKTNYYLKAREWPYKEVPHRIIAEKYMEDSRTGELRDYKFFCFNGEVKTMFIATERGRRKEPYFDFFDMSFTHLNFTNGHPNAPQIPEKPKCFEEMKILASKLSEGFPFMRCDFYEVDGKVYFGEITLFHHGGIVPFNPESVDVEWGRWINLPNKKK